MFIWIAENIGTLIISVVLALIVIAVIRSMIRNKKQGRSTCGCSCEGCKMCAQNNCAGKMS